MSSDLPIMPLAFGGEALLLNPDSPESILEEMCLPDAGESFMVAIYFRGDFAILI